MNMKLKAGTQKVDTDGYYRGVVKDSNGKIVATCICNHSMGHRNRDHDTRAYSAALPCAEKLIQIIREYYSGSDQ